MEDERTTDERFMREALAEARAAAAEGEVPIGAVVVCEGEIVSRAHNRREQDADPSAHAEFTAMVAAARALGRWRLTGCTVYVTLEPCAMCAGLMVNARVDRCVYGAADPKGGALGTLFRLQDDSRLNHAFTVTAGVLAEDCARELRLFFAERRVAGTSGKPGPAAAEAPAAPAASGTDASELGTAPLAGRIDGEHSALKAGAARLEQPGSVSSRAHAASSMRAAVAPQPRVGRRFLRAVLAIDSFKGSATSAEAESLVAEGIRRVIPDARITCVPIGDGGEGTGDALAAAGGAVVRTVAVSGAFGQRVDAAYLQLEGDEPGAFIEMAAAAGLDQSERTSEAALAASTRGVGELVLDAVAHGARTIFLGLGGSATTDGGAGFLQALGAHVLDVEGAPVKPGLAGVMQAASIDLAPAAAAVRDVRLVVLSDVTNPLVGERGAVRIFGPQKGLPRDDEALGAYDRAMMRYGSLLDAACRALAEPPFRALAGVPGAGAAGGLGAAVLALGGSLTSGIDAVLDRAGFRDLVYGADLVVTGEGMMDGQTAGGKAPLGVARWAGDAGVPVAAVVGGRADDLDAVYAHGIDFVLPIVRRPMALDEALSPSETRANLICAGEAVARAWLLGR